MEKKEETEKKESESGVFNESYKLRERRISKECPVLKRSQKFYICHIESSRCRRVKVVRCKDFELIWVPYSDPKRSLTFAVCSLTVSSLLFSED